MPSLTAEAHEEDEGEPASFLLSFDFSDWIGLVADLFLSFMLGLSVVLLTKTHTCS
jgi:hypothetical protein